MAEKETEETTLSGPVPSVYHLRDLYPRQIGVNSGKEKRAAMHSDTTLQFGRMDTRFQHTPMTKRQAPLIEKRRRSQILRNFQLVQFNQWSAYEIKWMLCVRAKGDLHNAVAKNNDAAFIVGAAVSIKT